MALSHDDSITNIIFDITIVIITITCVCMCAGVVLASIGSGLGEFTFLSLTAHFDKSVSQSQ